MFLRSVLAQTDRLNRMPTNKQFTLNDAAGKEEITLMD